MNSFLFFIVRYARSCQIQRLDLLDIEFCRTLLHGALAPLCIATDRDGLPALGVDPDANSCRVNNCGVNNAASGTRSYSTGWTTSSNSAGTPSYRAGHVGKERARFPSECSSSGYLIRLLFILGSDFGAFMNLCKSKINPYRKICADLVRSFFVQE